MTLDVPGPGRRSKRPRRGASAAYRRPQDDHGGGYGQPGGRGNPGRDGGVDGTERRGRISHTRVRQCRPAIDSLGEPVSALAAGGKLDTVRGVGKGLAGRISELVETGRLPGMEELKASVPEGLMEMTEIPGLGAKRVRAIYEELGIVDVDALSRACDSGELESMSGFGRKTAERIRERHSIHAEAPLPVSMQ